MESRKAHVYIKTDENNNIIGIEGEYSLPSDLHGWILIEEGNPSDRLNHAQSQYLDKPIIDYEHGLFNYAYIGGQIVEKDLTEEIAQYEAEQAKQEEIASLKAFLADTDYAITKIAERTALGLDISDLLAQYADTIRRRNEARQRIEELM